MVTAASAPRRSEIRRRAGVADNVRIAHPRRSPDIPPATRSTSVRDADDCVLDRGTDRGPSAVFTPEVENRKGFRAADNPRVRAAALRTDFSLGSRNLRRITAFLATLCLDRFWVHRCSAHHIQSRRCGRPNLHDFVYDFGVSPAVQQIPSGRGSRAPGRPTHRRRARRSRSRATADPLKLLKTGN